MDERSSYIIAAINDAQSTIRATDVKVGALLAGLLLPLNYLDDIWDYALSDYTPYWLGITVFVFISLWAIAVFVLVKTISAVDNPSNHISGSDICIGSYYGGGMYNFKYLDALINRTSSSSKKNLMDFSSEYPNDHNEIHLELSFEHMKLIYIRDIKLYRLNIAIKVSILFVWTGIMIYIYSKVM